MGFVVPTSPEVADYYGLRKGWCWTVLTQYDGVPRSGEPAPMPRGRAERLLAETLPIIPEATLGVLRQHETMDGSYWCWESVE